MGVKLVGDSYYINFERVINGERRVFKKSTKQPDKKLAKKWEAQWKLNVANRAPGWEDGWEAPVVVVESKPTLKAFIETKFLPWALGEHGENSATYSRWYRTQCKLIVSFDPNPKHNEGQPFASKPIDQITDGDIARFKDHLRTEKYEVSSINRCLGALRAVFKKALLWEVILKCPHITLNKKDEKKRLRTVSVIDEAQYFAACPPLLYQYHTVLFQTGMRPCELQHLRWEDIAWDASVNGVLTVQCSKTEASQKRGIAFTPEVREILEARFKAAGKPVEGYVWAADTKVCSRKGCEAGHLTNDSLRKQKDSAFKRLNEWAKANGQPPVKPFDFYIARHTYLSRLGNSGQFSPWELAQAAGHSNIETGIIYVHTDQEKMLRVMAEHRQKLLSSAKMPQIRGLLNN